MVRNILLFIWVVILSACGADDKSSSESSSTPSSTSSTSTSSTSSSSSSSGSPPCASGSASSSTSSSGSPYFSYPAYSLTVTRENDRLVTLNGDFEDVSHANYNNDPLYVYSGEGSGYFKGQVFSALVANTSLALPNIRFWIYSVADDPKAYSITIDSVHYLCGGTASNWGVEWSTRKFADEFVVQPHTWQEVSLGLGGSVGNKNIRMVIHRTDNPKDVSSEFYLDDLGFYYSD
jgi:hypothetical protein